MVTTASAGFCCSSIRLLNSPADAPGRKLPRRLGIICEKRDEVDKQEKGILTRRTLIISTPAAISTTFTSSERISRAETTEKSDDRNPAKSRTARFGQNVSSFSLSNGMKWIVAERHSAPIVACHLYADVGASDEQDGQTGLAHLLEHLAFKGTTQVGTSNWREEAPILNHLDEVFYEQREALDSKNATLAQKLTEKLEDLKAEASRFAVPNEYGAILSREGAVGLNAQTSQDSTVYYVSLPSNKLELWMALESARFRDPVFRELYSEKEVVLEERRLRVDNSPLGRFTESFAQLAFPDSPYGRPIIGYPGDLVRTGRREVEAFFREKYTPWNMTCSVVGDVDPLEVERMAQRYFGSWAPASPPRPPATSAPAWRSPSDSWQPPVVPPVGQRELRMSLPGGPVCMEGYWRPPESSLEDPPLAVLSQVLAGSRSSRFYKSLVLSGKLLNASMVDTFPGSKLPTLALLYGVPPSGKSPEWASDCLREEVLQLVDRGVTSAELAPVKKLTAVGLLDLFSSNEGLARALCKYERQAGSWRSLLREAEYLDNVSAEDVRRVAERLFSEDNRIRGYVTKSSA